MAEGDSSLAFGPYVLDPMRRRLHRHGEEIPLGPKAFDILTLLARNNGRVVSKETFLHTVWPDTVVDEGSLTFQISTLRKALGDGDRYIVTVPGRGYQLAEAVQVVEATETIVEERTTITASLWRPVVVGLVLVLGATVAFVLLQRRTPAPVNPRIRSLAVLPFKPIGPAQRDDALEIGMADTLIARISRLREIVVRPLTAVRHYTDLDEDPLAVGRTLGVDAVLDGSIQSAEGRIRVNARLLRVSDGRQIWQDEFEVRGGDLFAVQDSVSARVVDALALNLTPKQQQQVRRRDTANLEAYRAYALARVHFLRARSDELDLAVQDLNQAIALDPGYAEAWALLGNIYGRFPLSAGRPPRSTFGVALEATKKALALDPELSTVWVNLGVIDFWYRWDWRGAEANFRRAIELDPNNGEAHLLYAHLLSNTGRHEESRREAEAALRLEPVTPLVNVLAGQFLMQAGDYDAAIRQFEHTMAIAPDFWITDLNLGKTYELQGRYAEALTALERARKRSGENLEPLGYMAHVQAVRGDRDAALAAVSEIVEASRNRYVPAYVIAIPYAGLGDRDSAFQWLRKACADRDVSMTFLNVNPRWDELRTDPRFREIERCVSLP